MNINKLKGKVVENGLNIQRLAERIGMDKSTFYRKLNQNGETFSIKEANLISNELELTPEEAASIFFTESVA